MTHDGRMTEKCNKCKDCKYAKRIDRWNLVCTHEKWKGGPWGNTSPARGNSAMACNDYSQKR